MAEGYTMTNAIATQLQGIIDHKTDLVELDRADLYWQTKIGREVARGETPTYLVFPETIATLAKIVEQAAQNQWRILICGSGSKLNWGNPTQDIQLVISTQKCCRLVEHAVGDLTVTVEAGMTLKELQAILRSHNQFLPIDPSYPDTATLGGIVATADAGSWRERYGGIRDLLLGLSFVRADGAIAKAGGRVVKNVAGYDLMKLFTGAYGTLGIITQLTFRTYPLIPTSQTIVLTGKAASIASASQTIRNSGLTPTGMDLLSCEIIKTLGLGEDGGLIARWETIPESIKQQIEQVQAIATKLDLTFSIYQEQEEIDLWQKCATLSNTLNSDTSIICKIGIAPNVAVDFLELKQLKESRAVVRIHASSGIGKLQVNGEHSSIIKELRSYCQQNHGFLSILDAPSLSKQQDIWGYTGNAISTMQAIKNQFDPQNIFNPQRFLV